MVGSWSAWRALGAAVVAAGAAWIGAAVPGSGPARAAAAERPPGAVGGGAPAASGVQSNPQRPNIVFILADDLGWGDLRCFGNTEIKTPNLDRLAYDGTRFTRFYTCASVCSPTRAALLTGRFPATLGVHQWFLLTPEANAAIGQPEFLDPAVQTLPRALKSAGYVTGHYGKWHLGGRGAPSLTDYGFDEHRSVLSNPRTNPQYDDEAVEWRWTSSQQIVDDAAAFAARHAAEPFYLQLWLTNPHWPVSPSAPQAAQYTGGITTDGVNGWTSMRHCYYSAVTAMDAEIGRFLGALDALGLRNNTIVLFSSDNGPASPFAAPSDHSGAGHPGPFRGRKSSLYEGGVRAPLIVRWPGVTPAGAVNNAATLAAVDLLPTFAALVGATHPPVDGVNAMAALENRPFERAADLFFEWRFGAGARQAWVGEVSPGGAVVSGRWKLLRNRDGSRTELYDVLADPSELDNRAVEFPALVADLQARLIAWQATLGPCLGCQSEGVNAYPWPRPR